MHRSLLGFNLSVVRQTPRSAEDSAAAGGGGSDSDDLFVDPVSWKHLEGKKGKVEIGSWANERTAG